MGIFDDKNTDQDTSGATQAAETSVDEAGVRVAPASTARAGYFTGGDLNNRAAYGPDVLGGNRVRARLTPRNATVDPSLSEPRSVIDKAYQDPSYRAQPGIPAAAAPPQAQGPLSRSVEPSQPSAPYNASTAGLAYAYDGAQKAAVRQDQQQGDNAMINGGRVATSSFDLANAEQAARVSRFRATNGADMVLAPENSGYDSQRRAISDAANADAGTVTALRGQLNAAQNSQQGNRNYIDEFAKSQGTINAATEAGPKAEFTTAEAGARKAGTEQQVQTNNIIKQLGNPNLDPKQRAAMQESLLAIHGKDPNRYQVEHSNGPPVPDSLGGLHPGAQYVHIIDKWGKDSPQTLRADDAGTGGGKQQDPVAALKAMRPSEALAAAKQAIADKAPLAEVQKMLKAAGHAELE